MLKLRIDEAMLEWGIEAHRGREVAQLQLRYHVETPVDRHGEPLVLRVVAQWEPLDSLMEP